MRPRSSRLADELRLKDPQPVSLVVHGLSWMSVPLLGYVVGERSARERLTPAALGKRTDRYRVATRYVTGRAGSPFATMNVGASKRTFLRSAAGIS